MAELYSAGAAHVGLVQWARVGGGERVCLVGGRVWVSVRVVRASVRVRVRARIRVRVRVRVRVRGSYGICCSPAT